MDRRKNKFGLIAVAFVLVVCLVVVTGSTFSLFTSGDDNDIVISSGKLNIYANIDDASLALYSKGILQTGNFANGGTATFNSDKTEIDLARLTPGDKATFKIVLTNDSDVDLQYRINWAVTGELADALTAKVGNADITSGTSEWTLWTAPATDAEKTQTLTLSIELPIEAGNEWKEKTASVHFTVVAVQANATAEYSPVAFVNTAAGLQAAIDAGATEIILNDDITLDGALVIGESAGNNTRRAARRFADNDTEESESIVINLNGKTLTSKVAEGAAIVNNADVVITNGTVVAENGVAFENNATATLEEVTISGAVASKGADATLTLNESTVTVEDAETPAISATEGGAVVVNGGTYTNTEDDGVVVSGNVTITDGSFDGKLEAGDGENNAPVISGGNFTEAPAEDILPEGKRSVFYNGAYILVDEVKGSISPAYTGTTSFWGEGGGNAYESYVVTIYEGDKVIATASLNNIDGIIDGDVYVTWNIPFAGSNDEYWNVEWAENYPNVNMAPTKVTLTVDGVEIAENVHKWNAPDDICKIVAISEDADGVKCYTNFADVANAQAGVEIKLLSDVTLSSELTLPANTTLNGNGKQINGTIYAGGNLTFKGHTKVTAFSATYYDRVITIGEGACLEVTGTGRVSLAYGNTFNITGNIENAKDADKADLQPSLIIPAGISITGGNNATMNITNAYVVIGSTTSKNSAASGVFTLNFVNSYVEFTKEFGLAEPTSGKTPTFNINIENSKVTTGAKLMIAAANSNVVIDNSVVALGSYFRNSGNMLIKNGSVFTGTTIQFGENGGNNGTLIVDASKLTITAGNKAHAVDGRGTGALYAFNGAEVTIDYITGCVLAIDSTSTFTNKDTGSCTFKTVAGDAASVDNALANGEDVFLNSDLSFNAKDTNANSGYGATGLSVKGSTLDGNNNTVNVSGAGATWDCAVHTNGGTIKNLTVNGAFRGIFTGGLASDLYIDNVVIDKVCYTFNADSTNADTYSVFITNSTINGWTSYSNCFKLVTFTNCTFGQGTGAYNYAFCRPYNATVFENCTFEEGYEFDTSCASGLVFINCYYGDTLITAENATELGLFYNGLNGADFQ